MNTLNTTSRLYSLRNGDSLVINGIVWTRFTDTREFKLSPHGLTGDYDKDCTFLAYEEVLDALTDEIKEHGDLAVTEEA